MTEALMGSASEVFFFSGFEDSFIKKVSLSSDGGICLDEPIVRRMGVGVNFRFSFPVLMGSVKDIDLRKILTIIEEYFAEFHVTGKHCSDFLGHLEFSDGEDSVVAGVMADDRQRSIVIDLIMIG